jgi:NAD(P)-dependent dehydrogenase (short-subunit alcohol dehydrogenase family)
MRVRRALYDARDGGNDMRILVVGATGTIGKEVVAALEGQHEIIRASRQSEEVAVDISDPGSIRAMYEKIGQIDAVISAAGSGKFLPVAEQSDVEYDFSLRNKLMGQVNVVRYGIAHVRDGGSFTVTSGILNRKPMTGSAPISLVNSGLEGFMKAAAFERPRGIRFNVVSPPWVTETLVEMGMDTSMGLPAAVVAKAYVASVTGDANGAVIEP